MIGGFSKHSSLGKISFVIAMLTVLFFILSIVIIVLTIILMNPFIAMFSSVFSLLMFIFSLIAIILGAISYWGNERDRYGLYAFVIGIVFLILTFFVNVAAAATIYVYVSGMLGDGPSYEPPPNIVLTADPSNQNCTLNIMYLEGNTSWDDVYFTLTDTTDGREIDCTAPNNDVEVSYSYDYLETGKSIFIYGGINDSDELISGNNYRFDLIYGPTGDLMNSRTWTQ